MSGPKPLTDWERANHSINCAFGQGQSCSEKGGYLSDNPHKHDGVLWDAWRAGFFEEEGPEYVVAARRAA